MLPLAASKAIANGKSKLLPSFLRSAGAILTVISALGNLKPQYKKGCSDAVAALLDGLITKPREVIDHTGIHAHFNRDSGYFEAVDSGTIGFYKHGKNGLRLFMALEKRLKSNQLLHSVYQIIGRKATCYDATTLQKNVVGNDSKSQFANQHSLKQLFIADNRPTEMLTADFLLAGCKTRFETDAKQLEFSFGPDCAGRAGVVADSYSRNSTLPTYRQQRQEPKKAKPKKRTCR